MSTDYHIAGVAVAVIFIGLWTSGVHRWGTLRVSKRAAFKASRKADAV